MFKEFPLVCGMLLLFSISKAFASELNDFHEEDLGVDGILRTDDTPNTESRVVSIETQPKAMVVFYEYADYEGTQFYATLSTSCANVKKKFRNRLGSIDTQGHCVVIFTQRNCEGEGTHISRHSPESKDIRGRVGTPYSVRFCSQYDYHTVIFFAPENAKWEYAYYKFYLDGSCVNIDRHVSREATEVAFIPSTTCIIVYDELGCKGKPTRVDAMNPPTRGSKFLSGRTCHAVDNMHMMYLGCLPMMTGHAASGRDTPLKNATEIEMEQPGIPETDSPNDEKDEADEYVGDAHTTPFDEQLKPKIEQYKRLKRSLRGNHAEF